MPALMMLVSRAHLASGLQRTWHYLSTFMPKYVLLCLVKLAVMRHVVSVLWFAFYRDPVNFVDVNSVGPFVLGWKTRSKFKRSFHFSHAPYSAKKIVELD